MRVSQRESLCIYATPVSQQALYNPTETPQNDLFTDRFSSSVANQVRDSIKDSYDLRMNLFWLHRLSKQKIISFFEWTADSLKHLGQHILRSSDSYYRGVIR